VNLLMDHFHAALVERRKKKKHHHHKTLCFFIIRKNKNDKQKQTNKQQNVTHVICDLAGRRSLARHRASGSEPNPSQAGLASCERDPFVRDVP